MNSKYKQLLLIISVIMIHGGRSFAETNNILKKGKNPNREKITVTSPETENPDIICGKVKGIIDAHEKNLFGPLFTWSGLGIGYIF